VHVLVFINHVYVMLVQKYVDTLGVQSVFHSCWPTQSGNGLT